jgi:hypothetical protein
LVLQKVKAIVSLSIPLRRNNGQARFDGQKRSGTGKKGLDLGGKLR